MIPAVLVAAWFVCGMAGASIAHYIDMGSGDSSAEPSDFWIPCMGFTILIIALVFAVKKAGKQ